MTRRGLAIAVVAAAATAIMGCEEKAPTADHVGEPRAVVKKAPSDDALTELEEMKKAACACGDPAAEAGKIAEDMMECLMKAQGGGP